MTTSAEAEGRQRVFLVVVDDSEEMEVALRFACLRAKNTGGRVALLYVQEPAEFHHWLGVGELIQQERREEAEARLSDLSARAQEISGSIPILLVREGKRGEELLKLLDEDPSISIVVLAASTDSEGPGPIISYMMKQGSGRMRVPLTIVPGSLSVEQVEQLT
ncbi:MAG: universal stress protein [Alphaproteobacteria bacterium]|jgi:nucleotide-binding universal stress UspA family protein|uniref:universal stress protein n=1 Tax=Pacificispira sp. TaxID=2888761 RepID=UPI001B189A34|nr:universal stress protein [Alphaproteobacteria bacterium]MBO6861147.1 universal stress protein [Alphaproteobacteria bacterium]MEC9267378.1 universal stress protein [Pseudomonadota bacterium]